MKMAECILFNKDRDLWMESRKVKQNRVIPAQMDDKNEPHDIANVLAGQYNRWMTKVSHVI